MWFSYVPEGSYSVLDQRLDITTAASRSACWRVIWQQIVADYSCLERLVTSIDAAFPFGKLPIDPRLKALRFEAVTLQQTADLISKGHRIGCHSYEHDVLSHLSRAALESDFARCESEMDRVFNCDFYCYPFGGPIEVTEREQAMCRMSKFRRAFMNVQSTPSSLAPDEYALPRLSLPNTTNRYVIEAKLSGFEHALKQVVSAARTKRRGLLGTLRTMFLPREVRDADAPL
jgi:hypothetical protein